MADINRNSLTSLEALMTEFFAPITSNTRKREIESMLEVFANDRNSWRDCLLFLQRSQNQYVLMFTLTTLENIINRFWISLTDEEKIEIRQQLWNELVYKHEFMLYFIRNKLAAIMVSIARYDWPHIYPDFASIIVSLLRSEGRHCILGLVMTQAASEEFGTARDTGVLLPSERRNELERLMLKSMPQILSALSSILEKNAQKEGQSNPPPSPTSGIPQTSALPDLLVNAQNSQSTDKALEMEVVIKCLATLQHLFSWLPLSSHVPPSLVTTVFYWGSIATQSQSIEAALAGLGGVCEVLYRRYAPPSSATTALRLHHCALRLLRHLTQSSHIQHVNHDYLNKLAEFLKLFVSLHFKRLEAEPEFDAIEFLSYLFQFTFQVPSCAIFVNCLDIWVQFIDILKPEDTAKYWEALIALVNGVLNKIEFQHNKAQLQQLDNDVYDDDGETEWQTFLKHCIECIARVAELAPLEVFKVVYERWQGLCDVQSRAAPRAGAGAGAEGERLVRVLNNVCVRVLEHSPRTALLCAIVSLLHESIGVSDPEYPRYQDLLLKCFWKTLKMMTSWDVNSIDYDAVLYKIHLFYKAYPNSFWKKSTDIVDTPYRTVKTLVHTLVKIKGASIMNHLTQISDVNESDLYSYLLKILKQLKLEDKKENVPEAVNGGGGGGVGGGGGGGGNTALSGGRLPRAVHEELALILKRIGTKDHNREALAQLYDLRERYPEVDIWTFMQGSSFYFRNYVERGLRDVAEQRRLAHAHTPLYKHDNIDISNENEEKTHIIFLEKLRALQAKAGMKSESAPTSQTLTPVNDNRALVDSINENTLRAHSIDPQLELRAQPPHRNEAAVDALRLKLQQIKSSSKR